MATEQFRDGAGIERRNGLLGRGNAALTFPAPNARGAFGRKGTERAGRPTRTHGLAKTGAYDDSLGDC